MLAHAGADTTILGGEDADCVDMTAEGCARRFGFVAVADAIKRGAQEYQVVLLIRAAVCLSSRARAVNAHGRMP